MAVGKSILADIAAGGDKSGISAMHADDGDFHDAEGRKGKRERGKERVEWKGVEGNVIMHTILFMFFPLVHPCCLS